MPLTEISPTISVFMPRLDGHCNTYRLHLRSLYDLKKSKRAILICFRTYPTQTSRAFRIKISPGFGDLISTVIPKTIFTWKNVSHKDAMPSSSCVNFGSVPCKLPPSKGEISALVGRGQRLVATTFII